MGQHLLESRDRPRPNCCHPFTTQTPDPSACALVQPRGWSWSWGRPGEQTGLSLSSCSSLGLGLDSTLAPRSRLHLLPLQARWKQPLPANREEKSTLCSSSALPPVRSAFASPALNAQSGVRAAFSPGRAERALSEKKDPQTNKPAGFVCEQTVNCDGASFNLQIQLSTEWQPQIDRADQKNEYLFQGLTSYPQDTGYLVTYSVNIQGWLTQLSQGICSRLRFLKAVFELCHPAQGCSTADIWVGTGAWSWLLELGTSRTLILIIRKSWLMSPHLRQRA